MNRTLLTVAALATVIAMPAVAQTGADAPTPPPSNDRLPADSLAIGRRFAAWVNAAQADSLLAHATPEVRERLGARMAEQLVQLVDQVGVEVRLVEERWVRRQGRRQYWRIAEYTMGDEPIMLRFVILPDGRFSGIGINPLSAAPPVDPEGR